jgi:hypothetical protein
VKAAFEAVNSRQPTNDELTAMREYLESRKENESAALKQVVWALLTSPELRFNY